MSLFKHTAIYTLAKGIPGILNFIALALFTRLISPNDYGIYSIILSLTEFASLIFFGWINLGYLRFVVPENNLEFKSFETTVFSAFLFQTMLVIFIGLIISVFKLSLDVPRNLITWSVLLLITQSFFLLKLDTLRSRLKPIKYGFLSFWKAFISLFLSILFIKLGFGAWGLILGLILGFAIPSIWVLKLDFKIIQFKTFNTKIFLQFLRYGIPLIATFVLDSVIRGADRVLIGYFLSNQYAGLYSAGYNLANQTLMIFMSIINLAAYPLVIHVYEKGDKEKIKDQLSKNLILLLVITMPVLILLIKERLPIVTIFLGIEFQASSISVLPIIAMAVFLSGLRAFYTDLAFQLSQNTHLQFVVFLIAALINLLLNFLFIPKYEIVGAAYASLIAYSIALLMSLILGRRLLTLPLPFIDLSKVLFAGVFFLVWLQFTSASMGGVTGFISRVILGVGFYLLTLVLMNILNVRNQLRIQINKLL